MRLAIAALTLLLLAAAPHQAVGAQYTARVTWFPLSQFAGESMASGGLVYEGAFACPRWAQGHFVTILAVGISGPCVDTGEYGYFENGGFKLDIAAWSRPWWMDDAMEIEVSE